LNTALLFATALFAHGDEAPATGDVRYADNKEDLHVYLLIGQSNMAGRAPFAEEESGVIQGAWLLNDKDQWEPAKNPLNQYSTIRKSLEMQKMNPGYGFAKTMLAKQDGVSIGLVVNAKGGTKIEQWAKGKEFYNEAIRRTKEAQKTGTLNGILWHQGEANHKEPQGYLEKLETLITDLRADLNSPDLPFVAGQINNKPAINDQIARLPQSVPSTGFVSSEGLTTKDKWHFDTKSMILLGQRYANEMLSLQMKSETKQNPSNGRKQLWVHE
jgi:hypothetical protein